MELVQDCLRNRLALGRFADLHSSEHHSDLATCVFVSSSGKNSEAANRAISVRSIAVLLSKINKSLNDNFRDIRLARFIDNSNDFSVELKERFLDKGGILTPEERFIRCLWLPGMTGPQLAGFVRAVESQLKTEYSNKPIGEKKIWQSFAYHGQESQAFFAIKTYAKQLNLFDPTPRCLKCRIIHGFIIADKDLEAKARPNESCKCAEDICYVKLRLLGLVDNVILADA